MRKQLQDTGDAANLNQRQAELRRNLNEAESRLRTQEKKRSGPSPPGIFWWGTRWSFLKLGTRASVIAINKDGSLTLQAGILKMTAKKDEVYLLENDNPYKAKGKGRPAHSRSGNAGGPAAAEVDLRGMDSIEAIGVLEQFLDQAMRSNLEMVRIIHGKGYRRASGGRTAGFAEE